MTSYDNHTLISIQKYPHANIVNHMKVLKIYIQSLMYFLKIII